MLIIFLNTSNNELENVIEKKLPFIIPAQNIKHLGMNLTKDMHGLSGEYYKTLGKM